MFNTKHLLTALVLATIVLSGCGPKTTKSSQPVIEPPTPSRSWEDKISFEKITGEKALLYSLQSKELKSVPLEFATAGNLKVTNNSTAPIILYFNDQQENEPGSTKYYSSFEKRITASMLQSEWYLHLASQSTTPAAVSMVIKFTPDVPLPSPQPPVSQRETETTTTGGTTKTTSPPPKPAPTTTPTNPCAAEQAKLDEAKTARERGDLERAYNLCNAIRPNCGTVAAEASTLSGQILQDVKDAMTKVGALVDRGNCGQARSALARLRGFPEYEQAQQLLSACAEEGTCPRLGSLTVNRVAGGFGRGQGVEGRGQLSQGRDTCYEISFASRGDLEALVDIGYTLEADGLELKGLKDHIVGGQTVSKLRYTSQNVKPGTTMQVRVRNKSGNTGYTVNFYLYPN